MESWRCVKVLSIAVGLLIGVCGCGNDGETAINETKRGNHQAPAPDESGVYADKNGFFRVTPPNGWEKREYNDPRSKVEFFVPAEIAGQNKASLFFLSDVLSEPVDVKEDAEKKVGRLRQMGSSDASVTMVDFAGTKAAKVEASLPRQNMRMMALAFVKYGRGYSISFTAVSQEFATYSKMADEALKTFKCLPPKGSESRTKNEEDRIMREKIRVCINVLDEPGIGADAYNSLLAIGKPAIPQLEQAERSGRPVQRQRASELLKKIREEIK